MWRANLVLIAVVASFITGSHGASVPDEVEQRNERFQGSLNEYHIITWGHFENDTDIEEVKNTDDGVEALEYLDGTQPVTIIVHGREGSAFSDFGDTLRTSLINHDRTMAVILVDWAMVSHFPYAQAALSLRSVAEDIISFIVRMEAAEKLNRNLLHLIGFDLGAHVVGLVSRNTNARARKITALDPAGEGWDQYSLRLRSSDAQTVEVIHTDGVGVRAYGLGEQIGTLDFFANGGTRQPGCTASDNLCHHNRSWKLFAATVDRDGHLAGDRCDTMTQMNNNRCTGSSAIMGSTELIKIQVGIHRVNTGRTWPYSV